MNKALILSTSLRRMGLMLIIAVNLSTWISLIIEETVHALHEGSDDHGDVPHDTATTEVYENASETASSHLYENEPDSCLCTTSFCNAALVSTKFLFPFVIEFNLVASCLLIVTWGNIGVSMGTIALFVTIVIIVLLGTSVPSPDPNYYTESSHLLLYNAFQIGMEACMLVACGLGFYLFTKIRRPMEKSSMLDNVLLLICVMGPLTVNIFALLAVIAGNELHVYGWELTVAQPVFDMFQSIFQLVFILFGLQREPITSAHATETASDLRRRLASQFKKSGPIIFSENNSTEEGGFNNKTFLRRRKSSVTSMVSALANDRVHETTAFQSPVLSTKLNSNSVAVDSEGDKIDLPKIVVTDSGNAPTPFPNKSKQGAEENNQNPEHIVLDAEIKEQIAKHSILKIVSETRVARPDKMRRWLRDIIMFLLITNACLWAFMSLDGTAFTVYYYQSVFYGTSAWTTIVMICRPLSIFFRMHSAGCLFEMWSFA